MPLYHKREEEGAALQPNCRHSFGRQSSYERGRVDEGHKGLAPACEVNANCEAGGCNLIREPVKRRGFANLESLRLGSKACLRGEA